MADSFEQPIVLGFWELNDIRPIRKGCAQRNLDRLAQLLPSKRFEEKVRGSSGYGFSPRIQR